MDEQGNQPGWDVRVLCPWLLLNSILHEKSLGQGKQQISWEFATHTSALRCYGAESPGTTPRIPAK